jgi:hypothetical protein
MGKVRWIVVGTLALSIPLVACSNAADKWEHGNVIALVDGERLR